MQSLFEKTIPGACACRLEPRAGIANRHTLPADLLRAAPPELPELTEGEVVRHFTALSQRNFSVDTHAYPLGSCTMKYNPRATEAAARLPGLADLHPAWPQFLDGAQLTQGALGILYELERLLSAITGMAETTLQPLAGAHGELTGAMIMAAYHRDHGQPRTRILIPDSAHGTNPASAALAGFETVTLPTGAAGLLTPAMLKPHLDEQFAGLMLTAPNTLGLFNPHIRDIADAVHAAGGLLYYDGANLNALLGRCKPAELGFDLCHLNLHKTFATPHGGGGPGAGPVGVSEALRPYLPISRVARRTDGMYTLNYDEPKSIGYIAPFYGNFGVLLRAYVYLRLIGREGLREVSNQAVLNANYLQERLRPHLDAVTAGHCMHECVFSGKRLAAHGLRTLDLAKGLIDRGFHPPTVYFPLNVPEALMIEPTETETRATLDGLAEALIALLQEAKTNPDALHAAPTTTPVGRLDEVAAARDLEIVWRSTPN